MEWRARAHTQVQLPEPDLHRLQHETLQVFRFRHGKQDWVICRLGPDLQQLHLPSRLLRRIRQELAENLPFQVV